MKKVTQTTLSIATMMLLASNALALSFGASEASIKQHEAGHLFSFGETAEYVSIAADGDYRLRVHALGIPAAGEWPVMALSLNGLPYERIDVVTPDFNWTEFVYTFSLKAAVHTVGVQFMNDAVVGDEDRNLGLLYFALEPLNGSVAAVKSTEAAWRAAGAVRDGRAVTDAMAEMPQHRMAPATVAVVDKNGAPLKDAQVTVEQITSDFLFGASIAGWKSFGSVPKNDEYAQRFADLFNYATIPFFWLLMEPIEGVYYFDRTDDMIMWGASQGMAMKGHAPVWFADYVYPEWANGVLPGQTAQRNLVDTLMNRYHGLVDNWEVVNEPYHNPGDWQSPHHWARENDPQANIILNEYGHFYQGFVELIDFVEDALDAGTPIDTLGIQAHAPTDMAFPLEFVRHTLDQFAGLGLDLHITEFTPPSSGIPVTGADWRGHWTEQVQAEYAEAFYRVCFSHPAVKAISWWDVSDHGAWEPGGGMLRADLSPKPVYNALQNLIRNEWRTNLEAAANGEGLVGFDGFHGRYRVTVTHNGETKTTEFDVADGGTNSLVVALEQSTVGGGGDGAVLPAPSVTVDALRTRNASPTLTGQVANATQVRVSVDGSQWHAAAITGNDWTLAFPAVLADGVYTVTVEAENAEATVATETAAGALIVDQTAPVIALVGSSSVSITRGTEYSDAGAVAYDNIDGNVTHLITVENPVDTSVAGTYYVVYRVSDLAGNNASLRRKVTVTEPTSLFGWFFRRR